MLDYMYEIIKETNHLTNQRNTMKTINLNELLSVEIFDDGSIQPLINTNKFIELTLNENGMANELLEHARTNENNRLHWDGECADHLASVTGLKVIGQENTYNYESDLDSVLQYTILSDSDDWYYSDETLIVLCKHNGGDVRGNYSEAKVYKLMNEDSHAFLEQNVGYYFRDDQDNESIEEAEIGYSNNPTSELLKEYKLNISDDGEITAIGEDKTIHTGYMHHPALD